MPSGSIDEGSSRWRRWLPPTVCVLLYLVLSIVLYGASNSVGAGHITGVRTQDQIQQIWFLEWGYYALAHGHNPFFTQLQNYPFGINLGINTSMLALGVVFSPITALFGPIVTWNILMRLALVLSAASMCFVLRRWTSWWPAAFIGGLLYGFSAFTTFFSLGYLFLIFIPLPPLIFLFLHEILVRQRWRPVRAGVGLGLVCAVQYLISSELLASTVLMAAIASLLALIVRRKDLKAKLPYIKTAFIPALVIGGVLLIYPVVFAFAGPAHLSGVPKLRKAHSDVLGHIVPGHLIRFVPHVFKSVWRNFTLYFYSAPTYQGIPFLIAIAAIVVWLRKRPVVLLAGVMAAIAFVLSLGSSLDVHGHIYAIPLPFTILAKLPVADGLTAGRFSMFIDLFGAAIVAVGVDEIHRRLTQSDRLRSLSRPEKGVVAAVVVAAVALVVAIPLLPRHSQDTSPSKISSFFTSSAAGAIPPGSVVLTYPYPAAPTGQSLFGNRDVAAVGDALLDQAVSGMHFDLIGGYGWTPGPADVSPNPTPLDPLAVEDLFNASFYGSPTHAEKAVLSHANLTEDLRLFLHRYNVGTVLVLPIGRNPAAVVDQMTTAIGPPTHAHGVTTWFHVQERLAAQSSRT